VADGEGEACRAGGGAPNAGAGRGSGPGLPAGSLGAPGAMPGTLSFKLGLGAGVGGEAIC